MESDVCKDCPRKEFCCGFSCCEYAEPEEYGLEPSYPFDGTWERSYPNREEVD